MKFSEYVAIIDSDLKKILFDNKLTKRDERKSVFKKLLNSEIDESLDKMQAYLNDLNSLLMDYMLTG